MTSTLKWAKICPPWRGALQSSDCIQRQTMHVENCTSNLSFMGFPLDS
jgi:hypothetical protein